MAYRVLSCKDVLILSFWWSHMASTTVQTATLSSSVPQSSAWLLFSIAVVPSPACHQWFPLQVEQRQIMINAKI